MQKHCIDCQAYTFRDHPGVTDAKAAAIGHEMAKKHRVGRCSLGPGHRFISATHTKACQQFQQADTQTVEQRRKFVSKG